MIVKIHYLIIQVNFFKIQGINIESSLDEISCWSQPIIDQPEIGYLGFLTKMIDDTLYFLTQAKIEPGNINHVQLSPTLQATKSNYEQVHNGKKPLYLDYFKNAKKENILLDQLQSEQGSRFLKKRNRNIIVLIDEDIEVYENFIWLTLGDLKNLMNYDNIVNMDTRTVISGINLGNLDDDMINFISDNFLNNKNKFFKSIMSKTSFISNHEIISFLTSLKSKNFLNIEKIPLNEVKDWIISPYEIYHKEKKYFKVIGVKVEISNREVLSWCQPMIQPVDEGLCAFVTKEINGIIHFLVQAKLECGNHDIIELAPTVQTLTGGYENIEIKKVPFLSYVLNIDSSKIISDTFQSEEGGRFYKEQNRNLIIFDNDFNHEIPENFTWMTLNQLCEFIKFNNYLNIQTRSLISSIKLN